MIGVTGAAGFIGSCLVGKMNLKGFKDIIVVDDFSNPLKNLNLKNKRYGKQIHRDKFIKWLDKNQSTIDFVFHIGARTDTTESDVKVFDKFNLNYSKNVWAICAKHQIPMVYASSAATYGLGELGYLDDHENINALKPLNAYGDSKNEFDKWVLQQENTPPFWAGFKFFNVYGPNEYHKGRMASVILHAYKQIRETGKMNLFRSHHPDYKDGMQLRDFVYVKDVLKVICHFWEKQNSSGIYNLGTGMARSFLDLTTATFKAMNLEPKIGFIDTPIDIRDKYQYFTEANIKKLRKAGFEQSFYTLEEGVTEYVQGYLVRNSYY